MTAIHQKYQHPLLWGLLHGLNDFTAGYMISAYAYAQDARSAFLILIIYAILGFGGQLPVGFIIDRYRLLKPFAQLSLLLLLLASLVYFVSPATGIVLSGLASAWIHVTGGAVCLRVHEEENTPIALFTAPGVLGLTIGGLAGTMGTSLLLVSIAGTVLLGALILRRPLPVYNLPQKKEAVLDTHDWVMLGLLLVMCFRSFLYDVINQVGALREEGLVIIGISAFAGKLIGGLVADRVGWKKYTYITLPLAFILFQSGKDNIYALAFGIACLQSSVPITLLLMSRSLPLYPATAAGLSLGTSVALAGFPLYMIARKETVLHWFGNYWISAAYFALLLAAWWILSKKIPVHRR